MLPCFEKVAAGNVRWGTDLMVEMEKAWFALSFGLTTCATLLRTLNKKEILSKAFVARWV